MRIKAKQIAVGGMAVALTFVLCMLGALSTSAKVLAPAVSGMLLLLVGSYVSLGTAAAVFVASSLLLFLLPHRLSTYTYILLLGYYPVLCVALKKLPLWLRAVIKLALLTAVGCAALFVGAAALGLWENPEFLRWYPLMILVYYLFGGIYDAFIKLFRWKMETAWDAKLRKLLG